MKGVLSGMHGVAPEQTSARSRGFTLIELMIGIVIVAVLMTVGLPLFRDFVLEQRLRAATTDLRIALTTTRSEAVKRNRGMILEPDAAGWQAGWVLNDPNEGLPILTHVQTGEISIEEDPDGAEVRFTSTGRAVNAVDFEIDVGQEDEGAVGCLQLQLDGYIVSDKGACP